MLKIEVTPDVKTRDVVSKGVTYKFRAQVAYCNIPGKKYPQEVLVPLSRDREPYVPGPHTISEESFSVSTEFGESRLMFSLILKPLPTAKAVA